MSTLTARRTRWQFSTRALIALVLLLSPALAYVAHVKYKAAQFRRVLAKVRPDFDLQTTTLGPESPIYERAITYAIDGDACSRMLRLNWNGERHIGQNLVSLIPQLTDLREIRLSKHDMWATQTARASVYWGDQELRQLASLKRLELITVDGVYSESAVEELLALPLNQLLLPDTPIDEALARKLLRCKTLTSVGFDFKHRNDQSLEQIAVLPKLNLLTVRHASPDGAFFEPLVGCQQLKAVMIYDSTLSKKDGLTLSKLDLRQVQLIHCQMEAGFFEPFSGEDKFPEFLIFNDHKLASYGSHKNSIPQMEARLTRKTMDTNAESIDAPSPPSSSR